MIIDRGQKTIDVKLVYYGPALSGKTTNLQVLHALMPEDERSQLTSLKTEGDRTLFFDFLPLTFDFLNGWVVRLKTYTVPGQVQYESTRRLILKGVDGIAFIADSDPGVATRNRTAVQGMKANLRSENVDLSVAPIVLQYNKRDLPDALPLETLEADLNVDGWPSNEARAVHGFGVRETFVALSTRTLGRVLDQLKMSRVSAAKLADLLSTVVPEPEASASPLVDDGGVYDLSTTPAATTEESHEGALLRQAVAGAVDMASDLADANSRLRRLERRRDELACLARFGTVQDADLSDLLAAAVKATGATAGSIVKVTGGDARQVEELAVHGTPHDLLNAVDVPGLGTLSYQVLQARKAILTHNVAGDLLYGTPHPAVAGVTSLVAAPIEAAGRSIGLLTLSSIGDQAWAPDEDELNFARAAAGLLVPHVLAMRPAGAGRR